MRSKIGLMTGGSAMGGGEGVSFKKNGSDGEHSRAHQIGLMFMGAMFAALGIGVPKAYPEDLPRHRRGKRPPQKAKSRPNMNHISKRVRRKHRRAA